MPRFKCCKPIDILTTLAIPTTRSLSNVRKRKEGKKRIACVRVLVELFVYFHSLAQYLWCPSMPFSYPVDDCHIAIRCDARSHYHPYHTRGPIAAPTPDGTWRLSGKNIANEGRMTKTRGRDGSAQFVPASVESNHEKLHFCTRPISFQSPYLAPGAGKHQTRGREGEKSTAAWKKQKTCTLKHPPPHEEVTEKPSGATRRGGARKGKGGYTSYATAMLFTPYLQCLYRPTKPPKPRPAGAAVPKPFRHTAQAPSSSSLSFTRPPPTPGEGSRRHPVNPKNENKKKREEAPFVMTALNERARFRPKRSFSSELEEGYSRGGGEEKRLHGTTRSMEGRGGNAKKQEEGNSGKKSKAAGMAERSAGCDGTPSRMSYFTTTRTTEALHPRAPYPPRAYRDCGAFTVSSSSLSQELSPASSPSKKRGAKKCPCSPSPHCRCSTPWHTEGPTEPHAARPRERRPRRSPEGNPWKNQKRGDDRLVKEAVHVEGGGSIMKQASRNGNPMSEKWKYHPKQREGTKEAASVERKEDTLPKRVECASPLSHLRGQVTVSKAEGEGKGSKQEAHAASHREQHENRKDKREGSPQGGNRFFVHPAHASWSSPSSFATTKTYNAAPPHPYVIPAGEALSTSSVPPHPYASVHGSEEGSAGKKPLTSSPFLQQKREEGEQHRKRKRIPSSRMGPSRSKNISGNTGSLALTPSPPPSRHPASHGPSLSSVVAQKWGQPNGVVLAVSCERGGRGFPIPPSPPSSWPPSFASANARATGATITSIRRQQQRKGSPSPSSTREAFFSLPSRQVEERTEVPQRDVSLASSISFSSSSTSSSSTQDGKTPEEKAVAHPRPQSTQKGSPFSAYELGTTRLCPPLASWLSLSGIQIPVASTRATAYRRYLAQPFSFTARQKWATACKSSQKEMERLCPLLQEYSVAWGSIRRRRRRGYHTMVDGGGMVWCGNHWAASHSRYSKRHRDDRSTSSEESSSRSEWSWKGKKRNTEGRLHFRDPSSDREVESQSYEKQCTQQLRAVLQEPSHWSRVWGSVSTKAVAAVIDGRYAIPSQLHLAQNVKDFHTFRQRGFRLRELILQYLGLDHIGHPLCEEPRRLHDITHQTSDKEAEEENAHKKEISDQHERSCLVASPIASRQAIHLEDEQGQGILFDDDLHQPASTEELFQDAIHHSVRRQYRESCERLTQDHVSFSTSSSSLSPGEAGPVVHNLSVLQTAEKTGRGQPSGTASSTLLVVEQPLGGPVHLSRDMILDAKLDSATGLLRLRFLLLLTRDQQVPLQHLKERGASAGSNEDGEEEAATNDHSSSLQQRSSSRRSESRRASLAGKEEGRTARSVSASRGRSAAPTGSSEISSVYLHPSTSSPAKESREKKKKRAGCVLVEKRTQEVVLLGTWMAASLGPCLRWVILHGPFENQVLTFDVHPSRSGLAIGGSACMVSGQRRTKWSHPRASAFRSSASPCESSPSSPAWKSPPHNGSPMTVKRDLFSTMASMILLGAEGIVFQRLHPCDHQATHFMCSRCGQSIRIRSHVPSPFSIIPQLAPSFTPAKQQPPMSEVLDGSSSEDGIANLFDEERWQHCERCARMIPFVPVSPSFPNEVQQFLELVREREHRHLSLRLSTTRPTAGPHRDKEDVNGAMQGAPYPPSSWNNASMHVRGDTDKGFSLVEEVANHKAFSSPRVLTRLLTGIKEEGGDSIPPDTPPSSSLALPPSLQTPDDTTGGTNSVHAPVIPPPPPRHTYAAVHRNIPREKRLRVQVKDFVNTRRVELEWHPLWGRTLYRQNW